MISVIMLTYNREKYVTRMIESVLSQSYSDYEFIIVDNGSTDNTSTILQTYIESDERIRVVTLKKSSIATGRKVGLQYATGEYVTFIDDDDWIEKDYLLHLYDAAEKGNADIVFSGSIKEEHNEVKDNCVVRKDEVLTPEEAIIILLKRKECNAALPTKLIRRELFTAISIPDESVHEDIFVTYKVFAEAEKIISITYKEYCFVRHENNISAFSTNDKLLTPAVLDEYLGAFRERSEYIARRRPKIKDYGLYSEWSYMISMVNKIISNDLSECKSQLVKMRAVLSENYEEFYNGPYTEDFEKAWMEKYEIRKY